MLIVALSNSRAKAKHDRAPSSPGPADNEAAMPLVEGGACRQGEPGKPPQFIDAIANKDVVQMHALRRLTALQLLLYATPKPPIL